VAKCRAEISALHGDLRVKEAEHAAIQSALADASVRLDERKAAFDARVLQLEQVPKLSSLSLSHCGIGWTILFGFYRFNEWLPVSTTIMYR